MTTDTPLGQQSCTPCRGGIPPLTPNEAAHLREQTPLWTLYDESRHIERTFSFNNFAGAFALVAAIAALAEDEAHHPDIRFGWGYVTVSIQTHAINGLHSNDFILASKIDKIAHPS